MKTVAAASPLNGTLAFSVLQPSDGQITFGIAANASYSNWISALVGSTGLGQVVENGIWNNLIGEIKDYCQKK